MSANKWVIEARSCKTPAAGLIWVGRYGETWQQTLNRAQRDDPVWRARVHIRAAKSDEYGFIPGPVCL